MREADIFRRDFLLTDAVIRLRVARLVFKDGQLRHVAVFGGNNVGKSTVLDVLAAAPVAEPSPEGGHTTHAEAFVGSSLPLFGDNPHAFAGFTAVAPERLPEAGFDCYARAPLRSAVWPPDIVLWDTPDCDTVGASRYMAAVVEAVAAADLVLYVTSGEHYAVEQLVEWVFALHEAGLPLLECINKTRARDRQRVIDGQTGRIFPMVAERLGKAAPAPDIVSLRYLAEGEDSDLWGPDHPEAAQLRAAARREVARADRGMAGKQALEFAIGRAESLLAPARSEIAARQRWTAEVDAAVERFVAAYDRRYLAAPSVVEPFSRLNLAILELLDPNIPGLKESMAAIRWATRWPARLMLRAGRQAWAALLRGPAGGEPLPPELKAYSAAHFELISALARHIEAERAAPRHHPFWDNLGAAWQDRAEALGDVFTAAVEDHMRRTDAEIRAAAADIYATLAQRPTTLALLRGARVAANVGGALIGIVLPHHGVLYDLLEEAVVAPAMMSATEAATSAIAQNHVTRRKNRILETLRGEARGMADALYRAPLAELADRAMAEAGALAIPAELLDRLPANLRRLRDRLAAEP
ncbi:MAG: GTPase domain-containing protein [Alphaproteobacteria bacterium]|nr:GTPase domain-containing protein [Alphaproteobacteria bacterium]